MRMEQEFITEIINTYGEENFKLIERAFLFADDKHKNDTRDTGEPYIIHPYHVAKHLVRMRADVPSVVSGLLHDCIEDTDCKPEEIKEQFGDVVKNILRRFSFSSKCLRLECLIGSILDAPKQML